jgi:hypothetical protein
VDSRCSLDILEKMKSVANAGNYTTVRWCSLLPRKVQSGFQNMFWMLCIREQKTEGYTVNVFSDVVLCNVRWG